MQRGSEESIPVWREGNNQHPEQVPLRENAKADVCVVGAGIAGLTTAYLLQREGHSVVVVDAWGLAAGETGRTTAHLTGVLDDRFFHLEDLFGEESAKLAAESHLTAINRIESIVRKEEIPCDFERVDGYLVALTPRQQQDFEKERMAVLRAGFADVKAHARMPVPHIGMDAPALQFPQQACFHITRYMHGLAAAFQQQGGRIYTGAHVTDVKGGERARARTAEGYEVSAQHIVVATNTPINDWVKMHTKQAAYRTYAIGIEVPKASYPGFLLWDMEDPYHYVRLVRGAQHDTLVVGGEDHKTGQADDMAERYRRLEAWAHQYFPILGTVRYRWSGQVMEPVDSLGFIGRNPMDHDNVYIATGDSGNGMTHGTIAGMLITDLIQGRANPWTELYNPARKTLKAAHTYVKENGNAAGHMLKDWLKPSEARSVEDIRPGEGAVLRRGLSKVAVYRDEKGALHECSAVCPHLGGVVQWNSGEKSWDCPLHGSRFDCEGRVLNGPANKPLAVEEKASPRKVGSLS